jgi:hypothetical protein
MQGPPGVGKSAVAQTWSEALEEKLAAAFFFSRANHWNQPEKFLPTVAYQLCTKSVFYRKAVEMAIDRDPFILRSSIRAQFKQLLVKPLEGMCAEEREAIMDTIVIIDGLDECEDVDAQHEIVDVVTISAANSTTPFLWAFFSRPEPGISSAFPKAPDVYWSLTLPASSFANEDIEAILRDGFEMIRKKHDLAMDWVSPPDIGQLIEHANGNFAHATIAIRFIDSKGGSGISLECGPQQRLRAVLAPAEGLRSEVSQLDRLYLLVMDQIPKDILPTTMLFLVAYTCMASHNSRAIPVLSSLLKISRTVIDSIVHTLDPVLDLVPADKGFGPLLRVLLESRCTASNVRCRHDRNIAILLVYCSIMI